MIVFIRSTSLTTRLERPDTRERRRRLAAYRSAVNGTNEARSTAGRPVDGACATFRARGHASVVPPFKTVARKPIERIRLSYENRRLKRSCQRRVKFPFPIDRARRHRSMPGKLQFSQSPWRINSGDQQSLSPKGRHRGRVAGSSPRGEPGTEIPWRLRAEPRPDAWPGRGGPAGRRDFARRKSGIDGVRVEIASVDEACRPRSASDDDIDDG